MKQILSQFQWEGAPIRCVRYGNGHINKTYLVETDAPHAYILQKINQKVFPDIQALMGNIIVLTGFLRKQTSDPRRVLTLVPTVNGQMYYFAPDQGYWRVYEFITDSLCLEQPENANDLKQSGVAFGQFQHQLASFPAATLKEVLPRFHDTPDRYRHFQEAVRQDRVRRLTSCRREVDFYLSHESEAGFLINLLNRGDLPLRVTHNDTKLNNVMLDKTTRTPLCVIDLDTVMPGLTAYDFGDSIRFGASTAAEDEKNLDWVEMSLQMYQAYTEGFLSACGSRLTPIEKETLPAGAKLMTLECGCRFLTDYLNGDTYFHITRPDHNLDRARTQMKLVQDMEKKRDGMQRIIELQVTKGSTNSRPA